MKEQVLAICNAYEDGYETGSKRSPPIKYDPDIDVQDAWAYGYSEGYRHAVDCIEGEG